MIRYRLVLFDEDVLYLERLNAYIQKYLGCSTELFSQRDKFEKWLAAGGKADRLIVAAAFLNDNGFPLPESTVILDDGFTLFETSLPVFTKFQSAERLMHSILDMGQRDGIQFAFKKGSTGKNMHVTVVCTLDGLAALNPLAPSLCLMHAGNHRRVLWISLDQTLEPENYFMVSQNKGLTEAFYYLKSQKDNLGVRISSCISRDTVLNVHFLKAFQNPLDYAALKGEVLSVLLDVIRDIGEYDELIISCPVNNTDLIPQPFEQVDHVVYTTLDRTFSVACARKHKKAMASILPPRFSVSPPALIIVPLEYSVLNSSLLTPGGNEYLLPVPFEPGLSQLSNISPEYMKVLQEVWTCINTGGNNS